MTTVWLNGALLPALDARINPTDRGFTLGDGIFETIRAIAGQPAHLPRHFARLRQGAAILGIEIPYADAALADALGAVAHGANCALRLTLTRGPMPRGVLPTGAAMPTILIAAGPLPPQQPPAQVIVARTTRRNEFSPLSRIKSLNYGDSILARQEAAACGADDALLLNTQGNLADATAATIILSLDNALVTPRIEDGALPGIARAVLLEAGTIIERQIPPADLGRVTHAALVNALGIRAIARLGDVMLHASHSALATLWP